MRRQTCLTAKTASTLLVLWGTACTTTIREPNWQDSATQVQATTGYALDMEPRSMPVAAEDVLAGGLSLDQAMHLALARSMRLQAAFHAVGVAEADYAQSQMLSNPSLSFGLLAPFQGGRPQLTVDALQPLQDLWYREERVASADAERLLRVWQLCEVAQQVLVEVRAAWLATVEARAWQTQLEGERELARIEVELQRELVALGEGVQVDLSRAASEFEAAQLALHEHQASVGAAHIRLQAA
jgi:outer membrane protein TolC